jgi:hypothetical protein
MPSYDPIVARDQRLIADAWMKTQKQYNARCAAARMNGGTQPSREFYKIMRSMMWDQQGRPHALTDKQRAMLMKVLGLTELPPLPPRMEMPKPLKPPPNPECPSCGLRHVGVCP